MGTLLINNNEHYPMELYSAQNQSNLQKSILRGIDQIALKRVQFIGGEEVSKKMIEILQGTGIVDERGYIKPCCKQSFEDSLIKASSLNNPNQTPASGVQKLNSPIKFITFFKLLESNLPDLYSKLSTITTKLTIKYAILKNYHGDVSFGKYLSLIRQNTIIGDRDNWQYNNAYLQSKQIELKSEGITQEQKKLILLSLVIVYIIQFLQPVTMILEHV